MPLTSNNLMAKPFDNPNKAKLILEGISGWLVPFYRLCGENKYKAKVILGVTKLTLLFILTFILTLFIGRMMRRMF